MRELFVYYRVEPRSLVAARGAVRTMQQSLQSEVHGLEARWLVRDDTSSHDAQTWMEVYAMPHGIDAVLQALIEARAATLLLSHILGPRHVEAFVPDHDAEPASPARFAASPMPD